MPSVAIQMSVEEACSTLLRLLRPAPRTQRELTQIVLYLDLLRQMQPMWLHTAGGLSAIVGVVEALGRIASPAALEAARQQLRSGTEGRDFVFKLYMTLLTSAFLMTAAIRDAGQLAQLSDAGALRFGSAVALAVKAMPVLLDGFVEWAVREEGSTVQAGRWLADVEGIVRTGTTLLMHGVEDVLAGPSQRGLRQQLQPRLQRAMQAAVLRPQQLVEWLTSMAAAARVLFHLKGEAALDSFVLKSMADLWRLPELGTQPLLKGTPLQADVFALLADCTLALWRRVEAAGQDGFGHEDRQKLVILMIGMVESNACTTRRQYMSNISAGTALLKAVANLYMALPWELDAATAPEQLGSLSAATMNAGAAIGFLVQDLLLALVPPQHTQLAQQQQHPPQLALAAVVPLGEDPLQLLAEVLDKQHWLIGEMAAAAAGAARPGSLVQHYVQSAERRELIVNLHSWLTASALVCNLLDTVPKALSLQVSSGAAFRAAAFAAEAHMRLQPLVTQLVRYACAEAPACSAAASLAQTLPVAGDDCRVLCMLALRQLAGALLPTLGAAPGCLSEASAAKAACRLASCAAKYAWWSEQQAALVSTLGSSGGDDCASSTASTGAGGSGSGGGSGGGAGTAGCAGGEDAAHNTSARADALTRLAGHVAFTHAARIAVAAAVQHPDDKQLQGMLDCVAVLSLELLPSLEELTSSTALLAGDLACLWAQLLRLVCLLLRTEQTRALALARGAAAVLCRALAGALDITWSAYSHGTAWMRCAAYLEEAFTTVDAVPDLAVKLAADGSVLEQVERAAATVLEAEAEPTVEVYCAVDLAYQLAAALGLEAARSLANSDGSFEAQRQQLLVELLPALQAAAAAEGGPAGDKAGGDSAADAPEQPAPLDEQHLALRQARALGAARRCGNLRCSNLGEANEARLRCKTCSGCRTVRFCSAACAKAAWQQHKVACRLLQAELVGSGGSGQRAVGNPV